MSSSPLQNQTNQNLQTRQTVQPGQNAYAIPQQNPFMRGYDQDAMNQLMQQRFAKPPAQQQVVAPQSQYFQFNPSAFPYTPDKGAVRLSGNLRNSRSRDDAFWTAIIASNPMMRSFASPSLLGEGGNQTNTNPTTPFG